MDEPFAAVDAQTRADLEDLVRGLWRERRITIVFVTHDIDEAVYLGQRVVVLSASPTVVREELRVDLPEERDQVHTRVAPRFAGLRTQVYEQIQAAKRGTAVPGRAPAVGSPAGQEPPGDRGPALAEKDPPGPAATANTPPPR